MSLEASTPAFYFHEMRSSWISSITKIDSSKRMVFDHQIESARPGRDATGCLRLANRCTISVELEVEDTKKEIADM